MTKEFVEVNTRVLNFRTGPGLSHAIIRGLDRGSLLEFKGQSHCFKWLNVIDMNGVEGWVYAGFTKNVSLDAAINPIDWWIDAAINPIDWWIKDGWRITSPYGPRTGKYAGFHRGVDLGGKPCGAAIKFPFKSGRVVAARTSGMGSWGNTTCIELSPDFILLVAHQTLPMQVRHGQTIKQGDVLGLNGGTHHRHKGNYYSCHPHVEILNNNGSAPWRGTIWGDPAKFKF